MITKVTMIAMGIVLFFFNISSTLNSYSYSPEVTSEYGNIEDKTNTIKSRLPTRTEWEHAMLTCPTIANFSPIYEKELNKAFNYRLPTKTEWDHAIKNYSTVRNDEYVNGDVFQESFKYRLPTDAEWDHAIKSHF